jgi:hypothetical protein
MLDHIYGRASLFSDADSLERPHMFLAEFKLSVDFMLRELKRSALGILARNEAYFDEYRKNMMEGLDYYAGRSQELFGKSRAWLEERCADLKHELETAAIPASSPAPHSAQPG